MKNYLQRIGIALSVLLNVLLGGYSNQTFSARNYQWKKSGRMNLVRVIDFLWFTEEHHCMHCWSYWILRKDIS